MRSGTGNESVVKKEETAFFVESTTEGHGDLDLFNLKSNSESDMFSGEISQEATKENVDLFNFGAPSGNVDLLNINTNTETKAEDPQVTVHDNRLGNLGVDLLSLSPSKTTDSQNVDLFSDTGHKPMRRNRSANDILNDHHDHEFFSQLGSRSSSNSRENIVAFTVGNETSKVTPSPHSETFDLLHPNLSTTSDATFDPFSPEKSSTSETFDIFNANSPQASSPDPFDPFGVHSSAREPHMFEAFASSSTTAPKQSVGNDVRRPLSQGGIPPSSTQQSRGSTTGRPMSLGSLSTGIPQQHLNNTKTSPQPSPAQSPKPPRAHPNVFGGWGSAESNGSVVGATPLQPQRVTQQQTTPSQSATLTTPTTKVMDPFAEFGNLKSSLPHSSSAPQFQSSKPSPQTFPNTGQQTWSQQPTWQNRATPGSPSQSKAMPNYTPTYNPSAGSSVFGTYGLRTTSGN